MPRRLHSALVPEIDPDAALSDRLAEIERELTEIERHRSGQDFPGAAPSITGVLVLPVCPYVL